MTFLQFQSSALFHGPGPRLAGVGCPLQPPYLCLAPPHFLTSLTTWGCLTLQPLQRSIRYPQGPHKSKCLLSDAMLTYSTSAMAQSPQVHEGSPTGHNNPRAYGLPLRSLKRPRAFLEVCTVWPILSKSFTIYHLTSIFASLPSSIN